MSDEIKTGTKIDETEAATLELGVTSEDTPEQGEVTGQFAYWQTVYCPWCGYMQNCLVNTRYSKYYNCLNCGGLFTVRG